MAVGGMVGHLARQSFGQYDLPIPRPPSTELQVVAATIEQFGRDWSLPDDDLRLWVCLQELATHAVLGVPHVRGELERLVTEYVAGFRPDPDAIGDKLATLDLGAGPDAMGDFQRILGDPEVLLGAIRSPEQLALLPRLDALVAVVVGVVDHTLDEVGKGLIATGSRIAEAVRRRRVEADQSDVFVERLLGLTLTQAQVERGAAFVAGVVERAGADGVARLWQSARNLPTPAEVDAPGLWLARIDLPDDLAD
jgi:putative hydrolase